jgi:hypothetical protein
MKGGGSCDVETQTRKVEKHSSTKLIDISLLIHLNHISCVPSRHGLRQGLRALLNLVKIGVKDQKQCMQRLQTMCFLGASSCP